MTAEQRQPIQLTRLLTRLRDYLIELGDAGALTDTCFDSGCELQLDLPFVCIAGERSRLIDDPKGKKTDFVVAAQASDKAPFTWLITEMKTGEPKPGVLRDQIQKGMAVVRNCTPPAPGTATIIPLAMLDSKGQRVAHLLLADRYRVVVRGKRLAIFPGKCGESMAAIIAAFGTATQSASTSKRSR